MAAKKTLMLVGDYAEDYEVTISSKSEAGSSGIMLDAMEA
jgi:hypothetical protein